MTHKSFKLGLFLVSRIPRLGEYKNSGQWAQNCSFANRPMKGTDNIEGPPSAPPPSAKQLSMRKQASHATGFFHNGLRQPTFCLGCSNCQPTSTSSHGAKYQPILPAF